MNSRMMMMVTGQRVRVRVCAQGSSSSSNSSSSSICLACRLGMRGGGEGGGGKRSSAAAAAAAGSSIRMVSGVRSKGDTTRTRTRTRSRTRSRTRHANDGRRLYSSDEAGGEGMVGYGYGYGLGVGRSSGRGGTDCFRRLQKSYRDIRLFSSSACLGRQEVHYLSEEQPRSRQMEGGIQDNDDAKLFRMEELMREGRGDLMALPENAQEIEGGISDEVVHTGEEGSAAENAPEADLDVVKEPPSLENSVRAIRQAFGDELPDGLLTDEAYSLYVRLYGPPMRQYGAKEGEESEGVADGEEVEVVEENALYKTGKDGELEEVEYQKEEEVEEEEENGEGAESNSLADLRDRRALKGEEKIENERNNNRASLQGERYAAENDEESATLSEPEDHFHRAHPLTLAGRFQTRPATVQLPNSTLIQSVNDMLANVSNKHLQEIAHETFGGFGLPLSTATPRRAGQHIKQRPIALHAGQRNMSEREGDVFMAALMPGMYASVMSALAEVRKRLGSGWLEGLLRKNSGDQIDNTSNNDAEGQKSEAQSSEVRGPLILDAGGGGAAVFAFRDMLRAEWERMHDVSSSRNDDGTQTAGPPPPPPSPQPSSPPGPTTAPTGKATVLTGSTSLRHRASRLLSDTTFLPRMPDNVTDGTEPDANKTQPRKRYDVIVASHTLWPLDEPYLRKQQVEKLWSLLNPDGGVLLILEKGLPRGFEAVAGARALLLSRFIASPGSKEYERVMPSARAKNKSKSKEQSEPLSSLASSSTSTSSSFPNAEPTTATDTSTSPQIIEKETGMIIAPCTNHSTCPMYTRPGITPGRKDYCHFSQRFFRPQYLQNILGAKDKNFDDVLFSYVAVQRGRDGRKRVENDVEGNATESQGGSVPFIAQGELATAAAFAGYEDEFMPAASGQSAFTSVSASTAEGNAISDGHPIDSTNSSPLSASELPITAYIPPNTTLNQTLLSLPRTILPPLKRRGHVILDVCTPSGRLERWTVPRSLSKQAYRDARKSRWGDLWALGAKTRVPREPRIGKYGGKSKDVSKVQDARKKNGNGDDDDLGQEIFGGIGSDGAGDVNGRIDEDVENEFMEELERSRRRGGGTGGGFNESVDMVARFRDSMGNKKKNEKMNKSRNKSGRSEGVDGGNVSDEGKRPESTRLKKNKKGGGEDYDGGIVGISESTSPLGDTGVLDALDFGDEDGGGGDGGMRSSRSQMREQRRERKTMKSEEEMEKRKSRRAKREMGPARKGGKETRRVMARGR